MYYDIDFKNDNDIFHHKKKIKLIKVFISKFR